MSEEMTDYMSGLEMDSDGEFVFTEQKNPFTQEGWDHDKMEEEELPRLTIECVFPKWALPIKFRVVTFPISGRGSKLVFYDWVHSERLTIAMPEGIDFPLACKAFRRPVKLGEHVKKGGGKVDLTVPSSWPNYARWSGIEHELVFSHGKAVPLCTHKPKCPPTLDFPGGVIFHNDEAWVQPYDEECMPESEYKALMQGRARKAAEQKAEEEAEKKAAKSTVAVTMNTSPTKTTKEEVRKAIGTPKDVSAGAELKKKMAAQTQSQKPAEKAVGKE